MSQQEGSVGRGTYKIQEKREDIQIIKNVKQLMFCEIIDSVNVTESSVKAFGRLGLMNMA